MPTSTKLSLTPTAQQFHTFYTRFVEKSSGSVAYSWSG
jgi:hypothetical protein